MHRSSSAINKDASLKENTNMGCLIWADDILLMSKSKNGLENMLSALKLYAEKKWYGTEYKKDKNNDFQ